MYILLYTSNSLYGSVYTNIKENKGKQGKQ